MISDKEKLEVEKSYTDEKYINEYSEKSFFDKALKVLKEAGIKVIYLGVLLYYVLQKPSVPLWAKTTIIGALGYFISPLDIIPDMIPFGGYADDLVSLVAALGAVGVFIDTEVKQKAKVKLTEWFGDYDENELGKFKDI